MYDDVEQRDHRAVPLGMIKGRVAFFGRGIDNRKIKYIIRGTQFYEKIKDLINDPIATRGWFIYFIDHDNNGHVQAERLFEDETGLRHRPFCCIHQQEGTIGHFQDPFNLAAEIRMPWGINNINEKILIEKRAVF